MSFLYREAGRVLQGVEDGRASLKTLTLGRANSVGGGKGGDENGPKRKVSACLLLLLLTIQERMVIFVFGKVCKLWLHLSTPYILILVCYRTPSGTVSCLFVCWLCLCSALRFAVRRRVDCCPAYNRAQVTPVFRLTGDS